MTRKMMFPLLILVVPWQSLPGRELDRFQPLRYFIGEWEGVGEGLGGRSKVHHSYRPLFDGKFIHTRTQSVFESETHQDWGFFSYDTDRQKLLLRQFLSEGFVNTYLLERTPDARGTLVFTTESSESSSGMKARLTYKIIDSNQYELKLELAPANEDYFVCRTIRMTRVK